MEINCYPLVSILIPLYNHDRYITQCLDSIVNDTYSAKEIIILDDGSTDNSVQVVKVWYSKNREKIAGRFELNSQNNRGLCATLNKLVNLAKGDYIALVASDDYLLPGGIQARVAFLQKITDKLAVFGDCIVVDGDSHLICKSGIEDRHRGRKRYLADDKLRPYELIFRWCIPGPVFMARRKIYEIVGGYDESLPVEDFDFYLRLISKDLLGFVNYPVAAYRVHDLRITTQFAGKRYKDWEIETLAENLNNFKGLQWGFILASKTMLTGLKYIDSSKPLKGLLYYSWGRLWVLITNSIYELWVRFLRCK